MFGRPLNPDTDSEEESVRHYLISKQSFFYKNLECMLVLIRDVTDYLELQEERQKNYMMKMLHATVSHDMISPIHNIKFFADQMFQACQERDVSDVQKFHQLIIESGKMLQGRVKDLLDQGLIEHGSFVPAEVPFFPIGTFEQIQNILDNQMKF